MAQLSENTSVTISPVKESLRDRPTDKSRVQKRNSKVELLRIIGIVLILLNHGLQDDLLPASTLPWSIFSNLFSRLGGVGDVLFFGITAYYLCQKERASSIRSGLRRIWLLERQLLFYSIGLFLLTLILWSKGIGFQTYSSDGMIALGIRSVMPLASAFWWYPTSYAVFLLAQPFLDYLLQCGGKRFHGALAGLLFVIFSVQVPRVPLLLNWTPALFVYQYIVFSYVIRHCNLKKERSCTPSVGIRSVWANGSRYCGNNRIGRKCGVPESPSVYACDGVWFFPRTACNF